MPGLAALRASAQQAATLLAQAAGARICYLSITATAGQRPRILVAGGETEGEVPQDVIAPVLRRARARPQIQPTTLEDAPALLISLQHDDRAIGSALLVYREQREIDQNRVLAAATLAAATLDAARQIAVLHVQAEEIAERARVREIQASRNLLRGVIDSIPLGLALLDTDGSILAANRTLARRFDSDPAVMVGLSYRDALGAWEESPAARTFASSAIERVRREIVRPDGARALLEVVSFPLLDQDGRPQQVVEVWEDITERVSLQTQLIRAEKLAAIGQLAASIAHEVGNPLQAIQGFLSLFLEQSPPETPNRNFLELAEEEIERIVQVVARLRDLYRPRADVVGPVNVNDLVEHVLLLTSKQLERSQIRIQRDLDPSLPHISAVADQLKQVLLNLVLNAAEAMREGGLLRIQSATAPRSDQHAVVIAVADTGVGIAPDQIPRIFDGLHTTKERGMGLGLHTSKVIVERHMGRIAVQSTVGEGTTFTITLPVGGQENEL
ncbi:MAG TPA: ATP-binding protein [Roseiflexaceae bacterium]|nr:ATP-binding protein [Roseiflexaceae bacterium]